MKDMNNTLSNNLRPIILTAAIMTVFFSWNIRPVKADDSIEQAKAIKVKREKDRPMDSTPGATSTAVTSIQMPDSISMPPDTQNQNTTQTPPPAPTPIKPTAVHSAPIAFNFPIPKIIQQAQTNISQNLQSIPLLSNWGSLTSGSPYTFKPLSHRATSTFDFTAGALMLIGGSMVIGGDRNRKYNQKLKLATHEY